MIEQLKTICENYDIPPRAIFFRYIQMIDTEECDGMEGMITPDGMGMLQLNPDLIPLWETIGDIEDKRALLNQMKPIFKELQRDWSASSTFIQPNIPRVKPYSVDTDPMFSKDYSISKDYLIIGDLIDAKHE